MKRILVIHRGSLGDFLLLLPSLVAIRTTFPDSRIEVLGRPEILSLVHPGIVESIGSVERASLTPLFEGPRTLSTEETNYLASFDAVLAFVSDPRGWLRDSLVRLGIETIAVEPPFPPQGEPVHVAQHLFSAVAPLLNLDVSSEAGGVGPGGGGQTVRKTEGTILRFENDEIERVRRFLDPVRRGRRSVVAIHPGSGSKRKCWSPDRFEELARRLNVEYEAGILLILGPADERLVEHMNALSAQLGGLIAHNLPLRRIAAILSECDAYTGNDSGITHLAAVADIPTVAIFGPTDPRVWGPVGRHVRILVGNSKCNPCTREEMHKCGQRTCLGEIRVETVMAMAREALDLPG